MGRYTVYDGLLAQINRSGFCGGEKDGRPTHVRDFVPAKGVVTADQFAEWVLIAEGLIPEYERTNRRYLRNTFIEMMGSNVVDATELVEG